MDDTWHHVEDTESCVLRIQELEKIVMEQAKKIQELEKRIMHFESTDARLKNLMIRSHIPFEFRPEPVFTSMTSQELLEARKKNDPHVVSFT